MTNVSARRSKTRKKTVRNDKTVLVPKKTDFFQRSKWPGGAVPEAAERETVKREKMLNKR